MPDFLTPAERSKLMSKIRGQNTGPERRMASLLKKAKIPFKKYPDLPGTPDFLLGKVALFVDGDWWHAKNLWKKADKLSPYWFDKLSNNYLRDRRTDNSLRIMGFKVLRIWESDLKDEKRCLRRIRRALSSV